MFIILPFWVCYTNSHHHITCSLLKQALFTQPNVLETHSSVSQVCAFLLLSKIPGYAVPWVVHIPKDCLVISSSKIVKIITMNNWAHFFFVCVNFHFLWNQYSAWWTLLCACLVFNIIFKLIKNNLVHEYNIFLLCSPLTLFPYSFQIYPSWFYVLPLFLYSPQSPVRASYSQVWSHPLESNRGHALKEHSAFLEVTVSSSSAVDGGSLWATLSMM